MEQNTSRIKDLAVGDLVTHLLYGKEWIGVILGFKDEENKKTLHSEKALVQIQPGTLHESFFARSVSKINRINENMGYVTTNWLFKIEVKKKDRK